MLKDGTIPPADKAAGVLFDWPARLVPGASDRVSNVIANYVDQNATYPNQVRDFACGTRSYDLASGYNHRGVDISAFPFGWLKMDADEMIVVAAAAGTIVRKDDGAYDRICGPLGSLPITTPVNTIFVRHADGSIAWYVHMKANSLTPKRVGETVAAGERLGSVGSSGFSSGPHLHFEVYDSRGALIDPFAGACNTLNADSWWATQPPYWDPAIVRATVHSARPTFSDCSAPDVPNQTRHLTPGSGFHATLFLRDFRLNATVPVRIRRPDGSLFLNSSITNNQADYVGAWWYYVLTLPLDAPEGEWRLQADLAGTSVDTPFYVVPAPPVKSAAIEYYNAGLGHYFVTAIAAEISTLDGGAFGGAWQRTGRQFGVYANPASGASGVCRFFSTSFAPKSSHFYTAYADECDGLKRNPDWSYEGIAFHVALPAADGTCPAGTSPVYRMYNNAQTGAPNHRFTSDYATRLAFVGTQNWTPEGAGATGVGFCAPQ
jgi:murein DD-endopeptidase MepM/ murein hydrolase activator NlpD